MLSGDSLIKYVDDGSETEVELDERIKEEPLVLSSSWVSKSRLVKEFENNLVIGDEIPMIPINSSSANISFDNKKVCEKADSIVLKEGYLMKRSTGVTQDWQRRYFRLLHDRLEYSHHKHGKCLKRFQLVSAAIREVNFDRPNRILVWTPSRLLVCETDNSEEASDWITCIKAQIRQCLMGEIIPNENTQVLDTIKRIYNRCADCGEKNPDWVSMTLCLVICIQCAGRHRSYGSHISRVQSLSLDSWTSPFESEVLNLLCRLGNKVGDRKFINRPRTKNGDSESIKKLSMMVSTNDVICTASFLFNNDLDVNMVLEEGSTLLHVAAESGQTLQAVLLILNGAKTDLKDTLGKTPVDIAHDAHLKHVITSFCK